MKYVLAILAVALGIAAIVGGGMDDAPGAQLLGLLIILAVVAMGVRKLIQRRR